MCDLDKISTFNLITKIQALTDKYLTNIGVV